MSDPGMTTLPGAIINPSRRPWEGAPPWAASPCGASSRREKCRPVLRRRRGGRGRTGGCLFAQPHALTCLGVGAHALLHEALHAVDADVDPLEAASRAQLLYLRVGVEGRPEFRDARARLGRRRFRHADAPE